MLLVLSKANREQWAGDMTQLKLISLSLFYLLLMVCTTTPKGLTVINGLEIERCLGTWYEIARLDHGFEHGLSQVTPNIDSKMMAMSR